ncbi:hypothetical protein DNTS_009304 [Danionella cerebrum]|uniref:Uncharacterized protein n=1 Tax=Danionella cerebrum TaxID=2873325 RepID=A0A553Q8L7_9TELE|nr:hypothetical protein DNTS_009304 [Danionella translucida]
MESNICDSSRNSTFPAVVKSTRTMIPEEVVLTDILEQEMKKTLGGCCEEAAERSQIPATGPRLPGQGVDNVSENSGSRIEVSSCGIYRPDVGLRGHLMKAAVHGLGEASEGVS